MEAPLGSAHRKQVVSNAEPEVEDTLVTEDAALVYYVRVEQCLKLYSAES